MNKSKSSLFRTRLTSFIVLTVLGCVSLFISGFILPQEARHFSFRYERQLMGQVSEMLSLYEPSEDMIVDKDEILIKGANRYGQQVYVNGQPVSINPDGRFKLLYQLPKLGKQVLFVSFVDSNNIVTHLERHISRRFAIPSEGMNRDLSPKEMFFFNTRFSPGEHVASTLSGPVTRAELAYFFTSYLEKRNAHQNLKYFEDVPDRHWAASSIHFVVYERIMQEYPDGLFYPDKPASRLDYIVGLSKVLGLNLQEKTFPVPYKDVNRHHWSYPFIRVVYSKGYLPQMSNLDPTDSLSKKDFVRFVQRLPRVEEAIDKQSNLKEGFQTSYEQKQTLNRVVKQHLIQKIETDYKNRKFDLNNPTHQQVVFDETVSFEGAIFPPAQFRINGKRLNPEPNGKFSYSFPVRKGHNRFDVDAFDKRVPLQIWRLDSYQDLKGHWFETKAAKLRYIRITSDQSYFYPNLRISREQFSNIIANLFRLYPKNREPLPFQDVSSSHAYYRAIKAVYDHDILKGSEDGFRPGTPMRKVEAVIAIMRVANLPDHPEIARVNLQFRDLPKDHWAYPALQKAVYYQLIKPSSYLYPEKQMTKAELYSMLYDLPQIQDELQRFFR